MEINLDQCANESCLKVVEPTRLLSCARCKSVKYCDKECQSQDWKKRHKNDCRAATHPVSLDSVFDNLKKKKIFEFDEEYKKAHPRDNEHFQNLSRCRKSLNQVLPSYHLLASVQIDSERCGINSMRRWRNKLLDPAFASFIENGPSIGDVGPWVRDRYAVGDSRFHTMRNNSIEEIPLRMGETMIMIGFQDLHQLIMTTMEDPPTESSGTPFKLIAVDMSPVCVAKSIVVHSMMMENCRSKSILQVMFSSVWEKQTLLEFRMCCAKMALKYMQDSKLYSILRMWLDLNLLPEEGISQWRRKQLFGTDRNGVLTQMSFLARKKDRIEYARYLSVGAVFISESSAESGNVTSGDVTKPYSMTRFDNENIYDTIAASLQLDDDDTVLAAFERKLIDKATALKRRLKNGQITCQFMCEEISTKNERLIKNLAKEEPNLVHWSNCLDYLTPDETYKIVRNFSHSTRHVAIFMNWRNYVFGSTFVDYQSSIKLLPLLENYQQEYDAFALSNGRYLPAAEAPLLLDSINAIDRQLGKKFYRLFGSIYLDNKRFKILKFNYSNFSVFGRVNNNFSVDFTLSTSGNP